MNSNQKLIETLDALAAYLLSLPQEADVGLEPGITAAYHLWEVFDDFHEANATVWTAWLDNLRHGEWPLESDFDDEELAIAVACFAGVQTKKHYSELRNHRAPSMGVKMIPDITNSDILEKSYAAMLEQLCAEDRDYFLLVDSLGIEWYRNWLTRHTATLGRDGTIFPPDFDC